MEPLHKSGIEPRNFQHSVWPSPNWDISADMTEWKQETAEDGKAGLQSTDTNIIYGYYW